MKYYITGFFSIFYLFSSLGVSKEIIGDRMVLNINNVPYSQRQIESYFFVKEVLRKYLGGGEVVLVDAKTWPAALGAFENDILVVQESQRLGSFQPAESQVNEMKSALRKVLSGNKKIQDNLTRLGLDEHEQTRIVAMILRAEAFRQSQNAQAKAMLKGQEIKVDNKNNKKDVDFEKMDWFISLKDRSIIIKYKDADRYVLIEPAKAK